MTGTIHATTPEIISAARQLGVATILILLTVFIHGAGLFGISRALRIEKRFETRILLNLISLKGLFFTQFLVLAIFLLHLFEVAVYALAYQLIGAVHRLEPALYLSTVSYSTIGATDAQVAGGWRLLSAIEGINGWILLGWSTAFIVTVIQRVSRHGG